ncbi:MULTISPECIES: S1 RNA-binding domain-containing protein [Caproicibacterium]|jgi:small subunit ribosomal protein S1|uniref:S1 RNA-binding domain-containing protein n=1 Tax=Caproicibacterium lactatifermentans TaxID=2666138 RepID=A0A859DP62_9FIRM|nr:S1 RNA-binding domain-containing protein [Caproicibacterium lactatifermentans]ARP50441.1 RNA-binding protein [Ruminococcaceae bacterium CPB6]MDD4808393.1 S1 RNA-binding domain-containing protein [Oscillospiraceae bacterium]QKN23837.1 S1 RNA-binding domain-containing protein [Caproicibacterium lactatifermentans]QKO31091.1 S1 RNA-binding domain-containing protein [Caproicibacterium lactatifermentans]
MFGYEPEGWRINRVENRAALHSPAALERAKQTGQILEGRAVLCDSRHNLMVDLGCMQGMIPREEGALGIREGTVRDIALLSRVNRPVCFTVTGFSGEGSNSTALLSRRAAQEACWQNYLSHLVPGDVLDARVTHLESFGAFADIGCGVVALMPIDTISVSRIDHPRERFSTGMDIRAVVRSIEGRRVTLTQRELLGTWEENAAHFHSGETVGGIIRSVEPYGIFVELAPNLAGLAECRENVSSSQQASVYIKSILPARMKVKLVIIDTFENTQKPKPPHYYFTDSHMDRFLYSPPTCSRVIETVFTEKNE